MTGRVWLRPDGATRLPGGEATVRQLLARSPAEAPPPGRWERLSKPGLGGRERWRWWLDAHTPLYVKRYADTPWRAQLDRALRQTWGRSRAAWEALAAERLDAGGVVAARAWAYAEEMLGPLERRSVVVLERVPGDAFERQWPRWRAAQAEITRGAARHAFARRLAEFVARFHAAGLCHRDLYLCHLFVDLAEANPTAPRLALIDLARAFAPGLRRRRWIDKDLSQLDVSAQQLGLTRADRFRFLRCYLGAAPGDRRLRDRARRIVARSRAVLARIARKARRP